MDSLIKISQLQQHEEADPDRFQHALKTLSDAENYAIAMIEDVAAALNNCQTSIKILIEEDTEEESSDKGKGKERDVAEPISEAEGLEDETSFRSSPLDEHRRNSASLQIRLRECTARLHRVKFFQGNLCHRLGYPGAENAAYHAAEMIRRELLRG